MSVDRAAAFVDAARRYSELGWALVRAEGKDAKGLAWQKTQPKEPGAAAGEWSVWGQTLNIGVVCGTSNVAVLDVDVDVNPEGALLALLGMDVLPLTPIVRTGRGRLQAYFADPGGLEKAVDEQGIELRVGPHQCIAPPSVHPDTGRTYHWLIGFEPWTLPLAPLPSVAIEHFAGRSTRNGTAAPIGDVIRIGAIDNTLASLAGSMRRRGMSEDAIYAALVAELDRCEPGHTHTEKDCRRIAKSVARYAPAEQPRPAGDALGTHSGSFPAEKGDSAIASPRPDVVGTRDGTQSFTAGSAGFELRFVDAAAFADEDEPGAGALVGDDENVLVPEGGDVMFYGDGGAGKTTLMVDLGVHLAAGDDWLGIHVGHPIRVGIVENEGPRPLFRRKVRRKLRGWEGSPIAAGQLLTLNEPWGKVSLDDPAVREELAAKIATLELAVLLLGPVTRSGMNEAGTLQQVRDYANLLEEVRSASGRRVTFLLAHHENRGGQVSGAWEGAVDTLFHVQAQGNGQTRLFVQKARWSPEHHKQKLQLAWADGEGFEVLEEEDRDDNAVADEILAYVLQHGGTGWNKVDVAGKGDRLRTIRDSLLDGGRLINLGTSARMKLWHADDPAAPDQATLEET